MKIIKYPNEDVWPKILKRPLKDNEHLFDIVNEVLEDVKLNGDEAIKKYELKFDNVQLKSLLVSEQEFIDAESHVDDVLKQSIVHAYNNVSIFHKSQLFQSKHIQTEQGVVCWQRAVPIQKVGLYVPGGTAPLFSTVIMLATPAKIAGCKDVILCSPPNSQGLIHPAILFASKIAGVNKVFKIGGVQAIAAMAYGTETVPKTFKIYGPGNQFVMAAKQTVSLHDVAIDMPAGPSEVAVIADVNSNPDFVAADLLSQAEHGPDSQVLLISDSETLILAVNECIEKQLKMLPRIEIAKQVLLNSKCILVHDMSEAMKMVNEYAPEHLILAVDDYESLSDMVVNAGSVFLGNFSCESAGDYASGTNHTLPTNGYANMYSGVSVDSFIKKISFQKISKEGVLSIANTVETMAHHEMLFAHENAMRIRRQYVLNNK